MVIYIIVVNILLHVENFPGFKDVLIIYLFKMIFYRPIERQGPDFVEDVLNVCVYQPIELPLDVWFTNTGLPGEGIQLHLHTPELQGIFIAHLLCHLSLSFQSTKCRK